MTEDYDIINLCLLPDTRDARGRAFINLAISLSKQLNEQTPSYYQLSHDLKEGFYSKPHCTLMHIKLVKNPELFSSFKHNLDEIMGQPIMLEVKGLKASLAAIFSKTDLVSGFNNIDKALAYWLNVEKTSSLMELQALAVEKIGNKGLCITAQGEKYEPHFTLWARKVEAEEANSDILESLTLEQQRFLVPCIVALGDCGPNGQVRHLMTSNYLPNGVSLSPSPAPCPQEPGI